MTLAWTCFILAILLMFLDFAETPTAYIVAVRWFGTWREIVRIEKTPN